MNEEWKKVWYHKSDSLWTKGQEGTWCHVRKENDVGWLCLEYYADIRAKRNMATFIVPNTGYLDDDYINWDKKYEPEENEFGLVTP